MVLGVALAGINLWAGGGVYLATVGPTPIRFRPVVPQYDPAKVLKPLDMGNNAPSETVEPVATSKAKSEEVNAIEAPTAGTTELSSPSAETTQLPPPETIVITPEPQAHSPEVKPGQSQITPQMLLRYFTKDGSQNGGKEVLVPVPVEFTPPAPSPNKSSAIYLSPPAK